MAYEDDPANLLSARYDADPDGTGRLTVKVVAHGFAGESRAWFNSDDLVRFAADLLTYPIPDGASFTVVSGFGSPVEQEHVRIDVRPVGIKEGQIDVLVHLATPEWPNTNLANPYWLGDVRLDFPTTYERLRTFGEDFNKVLRRELLEATLGVELLA